METINLIEFLTFAKTQENRRLKTLKRGAEFKIRCDGDGYTIIPTSTGKPRKHKKAYIEKIINQFNKTHSFVANEYKKITVNASYTLTLVQMFLDDRKGG